MSSRHEKEKGVNVQVLLRCRPFSEDELRNNAPQVVTCNEYQREVSVSQSIAGKHIDRVFTFDKVFGPNAQQKDLYEQAVVPIVNEVLEGFNCTIFAYGQTGTGKTYTMEGECKRSKSGPAGELPSEAGVIPRAVKQIFDTLEGQNAEYSVKVTFLELYNEEITDLLAPEELSKVALEDKQKKQLPLMEDGKGGVLVRGLEEEIVTSASEIFTLLERGSAKRRTAETLLNKTIKEATPEGEELIKCGKLNLVDLAGSENISRSGAREGRAREAGEINKSLLTLGRVINALVEHLGHIPYRDSKLTRLLRDSLGGRTKTCIIATVSPAVHCLEETLSTLDYAHRAKNIKNKPEVNQKMMKSTLIKDLYGEIERLKAEVYAARRRMGLHPKERYYQEESERKAMADQIEQMGMTIETHQKQIEELQAKYNDQVQLCSDLSNKLDVTQKNLNLTSKLLANTEDDLKRCQYSLKERDFIISEQKRAENALALQACVLRADLEKSQKDNASLFLKIAREDKLNADNRSIVNSFQADLSQQLGTLCDSLASSVSRQSEHLQSVENLCNAFLQVHDKASVELKKKVRSSRALYISHFEAVQNVVRLHKAGANAALEDLSALASSHSKSIEDFLAAEAIEAKSVLDDLQETLSSHQGEMAHLVRELRQEQSRSEAEKLIADMTSLVSDCMRRQQEMVDARLVDLKDSAVGNKMFLDGHVSVMGGITTDLKRKWQDCFLQSESNFKDNADFSAAKHCRMELLLQKWLVRTRESVISEILTTSRTHSETLENLRREHSHQSACVEQHAINTFREKYMDYEPTGTTPIRCEADIPSKTTIESLRAMPMETLQEEFRENHSYESSQAKEPKQPLAPRAPLSQIN
ncbi:UNVERIFIED_CONTAM: Kinesin-like protein KIN-5C [Sesamum calycinum]|uniref:Kinesin-like protein n=1 Tax=Sesamum calycinum TaxID=2727403 RepID=A0AAW2N3C1_9LAMI